jgi:hypothetical protein
MEIGKKGRVVAVRFIGGVELEGRHQSLGM